LAAFIFILFGLLNLLNAHTSSNIQFLFFIAKLIPVMMVIITGLFYVTSEILFSASCAWAAIPTSLPFVVFAIAGFEAACSLSGRIENAEKNAPRAVLGSFALVMFLYSLYQIGAYVFATLHGQEFHNYKDFFTFVALSLDGIIFVLPQWQFLFYVAVILSTLGAAYGVLFSNVWNLHILAYKDHLIGSETIKKYNRHGIPFWCVAIEVVICLVYLATCLGDYVSLIYVGATGCVLGYLISILALCYLKVQNNLSVSWVLIVAAIGSCLLLSALCVTSLFTGSIVAFSVYCVLVGAGVMSMQLKKRFQ
jgi:APA family basic amino acid/polyamine antiporter